MFFLSERELKKVWRDTLTRAGMNSYRQRPSNFWLVRSEHAHASYPGLFFSPARVQPLYGAGRKESSGTGLKNTTYSRNETILKIGYSSCKIHKNRSKKHMRSFPNGQIWPPFKGYSLFKIVTLGKNLQSTKTMEKAFYNCIRGAVWRNSSQKRIILKK